MNRPKVPASTRRRVDAARAYGERRFEQAQRFSWFRAGLDSFESEQRSGAALLAGGLAYRFFFWLVAFGLVIAAGASFWVKADGVPSLTHAGKEFGLSGIAARSAASAVQDGSHSRWYLLFAGLVLMVYFGTGAVRALRVSSIIAWRAKPTRMRRPFRSSILFTALCGLGLSITILASWERHHSPALGLAATIGGIVGYVAIAELTFHLLPHPATLGWMALLPGALLVGCGITGIHVFTVYYLADKLERSPMVSAMFLNATIARRSGGGDAGDESVAARIDALA
jgi:uncharacterized BrkB/YihY/UPF0761 family membrane protein